MNQEPQEFNRESHDGASSDTKWRYVANASWR
jgi:hypothetical protein